MDFVSTLWEQLTQRLTLLHWLLLSVNILLLSFSRPIFNKLTTVHNEEADFKARSLRIFQAINLLIILLILFHHLYQPLSSKTLLSNVIGSLMIVYMTHLTYLVLIFMIKNRYGKTNKSQLLSLLTGIFLVTIGLIAIVQVWGFAGLLEAGGVVGFIGVLLALTQASWAPDIISGLIILNSKVLEEGEVISFDYHGTPIMGTVFKTKVFHTEILNFANNHRIMIKNSDLRAQAIHNLSRFASAKGLRERLLFKIGYDVNAHQVEALFAEIEAKAIQDPDIAMLNQHGMQCRVINTGDYAVEWALFYHTKQTRVLLETRQRLMRLALEVSIQHGVSLATPILHQTESA